MRDPCGSARNFPDGVSQISPGGAPHIGQWMRSMASDAGDRFRPAVVTTATLPGPIALYLRCSLSSAPSPTVRARRSALASSAATLRRRLPPVLRRNSSKQHLRHRHPCLYLPVAMLLARLYLRDAGSKTKLVALVGAAEKAPTGTSGENDPRRDPDERSTGLDNLQETRLIAGLFESGPGWTRTSDLPIMSRQL
jgi:hypothetical protein